MESKHTIINKDILFSYGFVAALVVCVAGGAAWMTKAEEHLRNLDEKVAPIPAIQQDVSYVRGMLEHKQAVTSR